MAIPNEMGSRCNASINSRVDSRPNWTPRGDKAQARVHATARARKKGKANNGSFDARKNSTGAPRNGHSFDAKCARDMACYRAVFLLGLLFVGLALRQSHEELRTNGTLTEMPTGD